MRLKLFAALVSIAVVSTVSAVPVIPNAALIKGVVLESEGISSNLLGIQPEQTIYRLLIHVVCSKDVGEMRNFLKGEEGKDIVFYTKKPLPSDIVKKRIKARVSFRGDERGGRWWAQEIQILD
jgi:hypothetical protein